MPDAENGTPSEADSGDIMCPLDAIEHHPDCDHWRIAHKTVCKQVSREGRGMWQAHCKEPRCDWTSTLMGPDGRASIARQEQEHGNVWTQCVGECSSSEAVAS